MLVSTMSPGETPPCAKEGICDASRPTKEMARKKEALLKHLATAGKARSDFTAASFLNQDLDLVMRPTNPGPDSEPSSWRTKSMESPLQVSATLLSLAFQVQACVSPIIVKLAFPP